MKNELALRLASAIGATLLSLGASAQAISNTQTVSAGTDSWNGTLSFPAFDPALGTLYQVDLSASWSSSSTLYGYTISSSGSTTNQWAQISRLISASLVLSNEPALLVNASNLLYAYSIQIGTNAANGRATFDPPIPASDSPSNTLSLTDPALLSLFTKQKTDRTAEPIIFHGDLTQQVDNSSSGASIQFVLNRDDDPTTAFFTVTYSYVPFPPEAISGTVASACPGAAIAGAAVQIGPFTAVSDKDGRYSITDVPPGHYSAIASAPDYNTVTAELEVTPGAEAVTLNFQLTPMAMITFYHQPGDASNARGHAFLSLTSSKCNTEFWGFYAANWNNEFTGDEPGVVLSGSPAWDFSISYPLNDKQYNAAAGLLTSDILEKPAYNLFTFNCMDWDARIASAAGVQLPPYKYALLVSDPLTFGQTLARLGDGGTYAGGTIHSHNSLRSPRDTTNLVFPFDYSYSGLESAGHTDQTNLAALLGIPCDLNSPETVNANENEGITISISGTNTAGVLISIDWGDGAPLEEQSLQFSHIYTNGIYKADLLLIDSGAVHFYPFTVVVSAAPASSVTVNVTPSPPVDIPNQAGTLLPAAPVPDFVLVQTTGITMLPNGHALISFFGVPKQTFTIEATTSLRNEFSAIGSATADTNGLFYYEDATATNLSTRFYRAAYP